MNEGWGWELAEDATDKGAFNFEGLKYPRRGGGHKVSMGRANAP